MREMARLEAAEHGPSAAALTSAPVPVAAPLPRPTAAPAAAPPPALSPEAVAALDKYRRLYEAARQKCREAVARNDKPALEAAKADVLALNADAAAIAAGSPVAEVMAKTAARRGTQVGRNEDGFT